MSFTQLKRVKTCYLKAKQGTQTPVIPSIEQGHAECARSDLLSDKMIMLAMQNWFPLPPRHGR